MNFNLLCIGDVVGRPGRFVLSHALAPFVKQRHIGAVVANVENVAGGSGLTPLLYEKLQRYGVDLMTMGDHIYRRAEILPLLERSDRIVRPANYPSESIGKELAIFRPTHGPAVAVISLMGRLFMKPNVDCPFHAVDRVLAKVPRDVKVIVVDVHAEATSEKVAMGWYLDGRVSVVFGTHTHVQTADERVLPRGTAYITDLGMTGPYESVLGRRTDRVTRFLVTGMPAPFDVATGDPRMCGAFVTVDGDTGRASAIERVCIRGPALPAEGGEHDD